MARRDAIRRAVWAEALERRLLLASVASADELLDVRQGERQGFTVNFDAAVHVDDVAVDLAHLGAHVTSSSLVYPSGSGTSLSWRAVTSNGLLRRGNYDLTVGGPAVSGDGATFTDLYFLHGDLDRDRAIDDDDLALLQAHYNQSGPTISYLDGDLNLDGTVNFADLSVLSNTYGNRLNPVPDGPTVNIVANAIGVSSADLDWTDATGTPTFQVDGYGVFRGDDGTTFEFVDDVAAAEGSYFSDAGLADGAKYWYRVRPYDQFGSTRAYGHTGPKVWAVTTLKPAANVVAVSKSPWEAKVTWSAGSYAATGYKVLARGLDDVGWRHVGTVAANGPLTYTYAGAASDTLRFAVVAFNAHTAAVPTEAPNAVVVASLAGEVVAYDDLRAADEQAPQRSTLANGDHVSTTFRRDPVTNVRATSSNAVPGDEAQPAAATLDFGDLDHPHTDARPTVELLYEFQVTYYGDDDMPGGNDDIALPWNMDIFPRPAGPASPPPQAFEVTWGDRTESLPAGLHTLWWAAHFGTDASLDVDCPRWVDYTPWSRRQWRGIAFARGVETRLPVVTMVPADPAELDEEPDITFDFYAERSGDSGIVPIAAPVDFETLSTADGGDFTLLTDPIFEFSSGAESAGPVTISLLGDDLPESDELAVAQLLRPDGALYTVGEPDTAELTIVNEDSWVWMLRGGELDALEGDSQHPGEFHLARELAVDRALSVNLVYDGYAERNNDFFAPETAYFPAGEPTTTVIFGANDDPLPQPVRTFTAGIAPGEHYTVKETEPSTSDTLQILNDDPWNTPPPIPNPNAPTPTPADPSAPPTPAVPGKPGDDGNDGGGGPTPWQPSDPDDDSPQAWVDVSLGYYGIHGWNWAYDKMDEKWWGDNYGEGVATGALLRLNDDFDETPYDGTDIQPPLDLEKQGIKPWDGEIAPLDMFAWTDAESDTGVWSLTWDSTKADVYRVLLDGEGHYAGYDLVGSGVWSGTLNELRAFDSAQGYWWNAWGASAFVDPVGLSGSIDDLAFRLEFSPIGTNVTVVDTAKATVIAPDVDTDADNNDEWYLPDSSRQEEWREGSNGGKTLYVNDGDIDGDGVIDWADGYNLKNAEHSDNSIGSEMMRYFVPVMLKFPPVFDANEASFEVLYLDSDPSAVTRTGLGTSEDPFVYAPPHLASLRLWTNNSPSRDKRPVSEGGDWVPSDVPFTASQVDVISGNAVVLYAEAVGPTPYNGSAHVQAYIDLDGEGPIGEMIMDNVGFDVKRLRLNLQYTTFIRYEWLWAPNDGFSIFGGDDREIRTGAAIFGRDQRSFRTRQRVEIIPNTVSDLDGIKNGTLQNFTGATKKYRYLSSLDSPLSLSSARLTRAAKADRILDQHLLPFQQGNGMLWDEAYASTSDPGFKLTGQRLSGLSPWLTTYRIEHSVGNPLNFGPKIDADLSIGVDSRNPYDVRVGVGGMHDGFPCHEIYVNNTLVYSYDTGAYGYSSSSPMALFPTMDVSVNAPVVRVDDE